MANNRILIVGNPPLNHDAAATVQLEIHVPPMHLDYALQVP
jgi:hypothetical protein